MQSARAHLTQHACGVRQRAPRNLLQQRSPSGEQRASRTCTHVPRIVTQRGGLRHVRDAVVGEEPSYTSGSIPVASVPDAFNGGVPPDHPNPPDLHNNATYRPQQGPPRRTSRAAEQLRQLTAARQESLAAMQQARSTYNMGAAQAVDVRMYEQAVAARNRLSQKLSDTNMYCDVLEDRLQENTHQIIDTQEFLKVALSRTIELRRLAESMYVSIKYSSDKETSLNRIMYLQQHLEDLDKGLDGHLQTLQDIVPRKVPMVWQGVASEVRVMGDFDRWTRGVLLSAEDVTNDNVVATFRGELLLAPGKYWIKFLVDNEWRLAPDWPTETDHLGEANNVVIVRG